MVHISTGADVSVLGQCNLALDLSCIISIVT